MRVFLDASPFACTAPTNSPMSFSANASRTVSLRFGLPILLYIFDTEPLPQINVNSWARDPYVQSLTEGLKTKPFPEAVDDATEVFTAVCVRFIELFGSRGKA